MSPVPVASALPAAPGERSAPGLHGALNALDLSARAYAADGWSAEAGCALRQARRDAARQLAAGGAQLREGTALGRQFIDVLQHLAASGILGLPAERAELDLAAALETLGWRGRLGRMLLAPCWQGPKPVPFANLPSWLWGTAARWVFQTAALYPSTGELEQHVGMMETALAELLRWRGRNAGSPAVRSALDAVEASLRIDRIGASPSSLRGLKELQARLIRSRCRPAKEIYESVAFLRLGRPTRVGCILPGAGDHAAARSALRLIAGLDRSRFEALVYTEAPASADVAVRLGGRPATLRILAGRLEDQVETLRGAGLDAVLFALDRPAPTDAVTRLAAFRVAPLQLVNDHGGGSTGLAEIDLYVMAAKPGDAPPPAEFSERLGLLNLAAPMADEPRAHLDRAAAYPRADLGVKPEATVFASALPAWQVTPETRATWARLLARTPGSFLLLHPFQDSGRTGPESAIFCSAMDRALAAAGVAPERLIISGTPLPSAAAVRALMRAGNVYLGSVEGHPTPHLAELLASGLPAVVGAGDQPWSRRSEAVMRDFGVEAHTARSPDEFVALAARLATDPGRRADFSSCVQRRLKAGAVSLDPLAHSLAWGALIEAAYDSLADSDRDRFRAAPQPFTAGNAAEIERLAAEWEDHFSEERYAEAAAAGRHLVGFQPANLQTREQVGRALAAAGDFDEARRFLFGEATAAAFAPAAWHALGDWLRAHGAWPLAMEALHASLRADHAQPEVWRKLAELAAEQGAVETADQARAMAERCAGAAVAG
jgi:hypothetical protein